MVELILGTYGVLCWLVFKKFKLIPLNTYTGTGAALGGVGLIGFILLMVFTYQPQSGDGRLYATVTPLVAQVRGVVVEVHARETTEVKKGDALIKIDPTAYQAAVDRYTAQLKTADANLARAEQLLKQGVGRQAAVDEARGQADGLRAQLAAAQFDLDNTVVRAPADGYVTQVTVRPGQIAVPAPFAPLMVFVHGAEPVLIASYPQQTIKTIQPGQQAEFAFDAYPGYIFKGTVRSKLPATPEGQLIASGTLRGATPQQAPGRVPVVFEYGDDLKALKLPVGAKAKVAVYTEDFAWLGIIQKILMRIKSWEAYIFLP